MNLIGWEHDYVNGREKQFYIQEGKMTNAEWDAASPLAKLLASRKFLILVMDTIISLALYFSGKYLLPEANNDIVFVVALLQVPVAFIINAIAHEDAAQAEAEAKLKIAQAELDALRSGESLGLSSTTGISRQD